MNGILKSDGGQLEDWRLEHAGVAWVVSGKIYGDPKERFEDGTPIITTPVLWINGGRLATQNSFYNLGRWKA